MTSWHQGETWNCPGSWNPTGSLNLWSQEHNILCSGECSSRSHQHKNLKINSLELSWRSKKSKVQGWEFYGVASPQTSTRSNEGFRLHLGPHTLFPEFLLFMKKITHQNFLHSVCCCVRLLRYGDQAHFYFLMEGEKHHVIMADWETELTIELLGGVLVFNCLVYLHWNLPTFGHPCSDTLQNFITRELPQWKPDFGSPLKWPQGLWHLQEFSDMLPYPSTSHRSPGCCLPIVARTEAMNPTPALHDSCQESLNPHYIWETHYSTCYAFCDPFSRPRPRYHDLWVSSEDTSLRQNHLSTWMGDSPV